MQSKAEAKAIELQFHGGSWGALLPFFVLVVGVIILALSGAPDERGFWPILLLALAIGLLLSKNRTDYANAVIDGMSERIVMVMILAWTLASVIGVFMSATGLVEGLSWLASQANLGGGGMIVASFLICCVVSVSTGSSFATILICAPILYPASGVLGAHLPLLAGAILGGATWGDCIAPISDTTIAAATSQDTDIGGTVRSRLKYVLPVGIASLLIYVAFALVGDADIQGSHVFSGSPRGLPMLLVPIVVVLLFLRGVHLMTGLLFGVVLGVILGLCLGLIQPTQLLSLDLENFTAKSLVIDGFNRSVGLSFFTIFLMGLVGAFKASGIFAKLVEVASSRDQDHAGVEWWIGAMTSVAVLLTTHSVVAILLVGDFVNDAGSKARIHPYRRANLMSLVVCTFPFLFPYFIPVILLSSATSIGADYGIRSVTPLEAGMYNIVGWGLLVMVVLALGLGYGRARDKINA